MSPLSSNFQATPPRDLSKPVIAPYIYKEFPKLMYHPTEKTPQSILARNKILQHNKLHPATPEIVPDLLPVTALVKSKKEQEAYESRGYSTQAPHPYGDDEKSDELLLEEAQPEAAATVIARKKKKAKPVEEEE